LGYALARFGYGILNGSRELAFLDEGLELDSVREPKEDLSRADNY
jgi:hypothetical protein